MKKDIFKSRMAPMSGRSQKLTAHTFFIENNPHGYFTKSDFITYAEGLEGNEPPHLKEGIEQLSTGARIIYDPNVKVHKATGNHYYWLAFKLANADRGFMIAANDGMQKLIKDYAMGKITIGFTVDELYDVATAEQS